MSEQAGFVAFSGCLGALAGLGASLVDIGLGPTDFSAFDDTLFALGIYALAGFGCGLGLGLGFWLLTRLRRSLSLRLEYAFSGNTFSARRA